MNCPLCKLSMTPKTLDHEDQYPKWFICFNQNCSFYGMPRINKEWFDEHNEEMF